MLSNVQQMYTSVLSQIVILKYLILSYSVGIFFFFLVLAFSLQVFTLVKNMPKAVEGIFFLN